MVQGLAQAPRMDDPGLVALEKLRPAGRVGWVTDGDRCQDGNPDGICYLIAPPQPPVVAADRKRDDGSGQRAQQGAEPSINEQAHGQRRPRGARRGLQHPRTRAADVGDVAVGDSVRDVLRLGGGRALGANRERCRGSGC